MSRGMGPMLGDLIGIIVGLWVLFGGAFGEIENRRVIEAVAGIVVILSIWRIWRRARDTS